ncbi:enoyl-CoA hydratase/isomerase family protein [Rummeliibacillus sp. SL167]|uniref:enoyl-CoA hydratase/isomerase family protein n=1 Tax=Rummeliibacillus sp. SL167 TaxID=2579792 RepID=UPI0011B64694|nr:enoyl-CoA hydratase/isomerase family protein [Rummeliibacillus sp. SL167]
MSYYFSESDGVLTFTINRPEKRNAINDAVMEGFKEVITYVHNHASVRFLVVTGEGEKAFCSGGDLAEFHNLHTEEQAFGMLSKMAKILYELATLPVPTIALVNGTAVGGGCEIATACDFRLVKKGAKCGFIQGTLGITSGWGGGTYLFERGLRHDRALKMLVDAKAYPADLLYEIGFAMRIFENDKEQALAEFIEDMKKIHPNVHKAYKEMELRKWRERHLFDRVMDEVKTCAKLWESEEHQQAVKQFLSKTK